jgi:Tfp pilus assembly protein PilX
MRGERRKIAVKRLIRDEKGYILILALLVLVLVGLISGPLLSYMVSGLRAGHVFETGAAELYAADAGVEDAVWRIPNAGLCPGSPSTSYNITNVNGKSVGVTITLVNNTSGTLNYKITSVATTGSNSHTTIESYIKFTPGGELNIFSGVLASKGNINIVSGTVTGDIYYGGTLSGGFTHLSGNETPVESGDFPTQAQNVAFAQALKNQAMAGGNHTGNMDISSACTLGPIYISGNLNISKDVTITINGVVYVKGSITASKDYTLAGSGSIIAEGDIDVRKIAGFGTTGDCIIMSLNGNIVFKKDAAVEALIYAPNGTVSTDKNLTVTGGIVAGVGIDIKKDASLTYTPKAGGFDLPGELQGSLEIKTYSVSRYP